MSQANIALQEKRAFNLDEYAAIIAAYKPIIRSFHEVETAAPESEFCLIRHDIEFSLPRALQLAELDSALGIASSFFVQVKNGAYNPLSPINSQIIRKIRQTGHAVGLHFYISDLAEGDVKETLRQLKFQTLVLEEALGEKIASFSYHRPPLWALKLNLRGETDLINAYDPKFFELTSGAEPPLYIKYMADSQHAWKYGHPLAFRDKFKKFQLLMHPDEWSAAGSLPAENFRELFELNRAEFRQTLQTECNHFKVHANEI